MFITRNIQEGGWSSSWLNETFSYVSLRDITILHELDDEKHNSQRFFLGVFLFFYFQTSERSSVETLSNCNISGSVSNHI